MDVPSCAAALESAAAEAMQQGLHQASKSPSAHIHGTGKGSAVLRQGSFAHLQHTHSHRQAAQGPGEA